jgi:outer membrane protein assembly factor BamD
MSKQIVRIALFSALLAAGACGGNRNETPATIPNPDRFLYDRALASLKDEKWLDAREYFRQVVDNYPQSPLRPDAKLGIGDSYLGEDTGESLVLAANEYREFLTFYPTNPRADYAQYKLAMSYYQQMRAPARDQTETKEALREFQVFFDRFPNSRLMPEVRQRWREARDRLSEHDLGVGVHYYRIRWWPGAIPRLQEILKTDPEFTHRDSVYFYLADSLARADRPDEAIPYFERLLKEFTQSEHLQDAQERLADLKSREPRTQ